MVLNTLICKKCPHVSGSGLFCYLDDVNSVVIDALDKPPRGCPYPAEHLLLSEDSIDNGCSFYIQQEIVDISIPLTSEWFYSYYIAVVKADYGNRGETLSNHRIVAFMGDENKWTPRFWECVPEEDLNLLTRKEAMRQFDTFVEGYRLMLQEQIEFCDNFTKRIK